MPKYCVLTDADLASLLNKGDECAFAEIYDRYWALLYRHALRMLDDEDQAGDVVQEVFLSLWNKAIETTITTSLSSFLYTATRNRILNYWTSEKARQKHIALFHDFVQQQESGTDYKVRANMLSELIELEVAALPQHMREAFELSRHQHLSYKEIAEELGVSEHVVRNNISRALKILRVRLGDLAVIMLFINT